MSLGLFYLPNDGVEPKVGRQGVALRLSEWNNLKESITELHAAMPDLTQALPCSYSTDHNNLMWCMSCKECSQFEIMDLFIPDELPFITCKDTNDYEAKTTHAFKQPEPVECDCDAMNHHADPHKCDPTYMKKKPPNMIIWTLTHEAYEHDHLDFWRIDRLWTTSSLDFDYSLEIIFRNLNILFSFYKWHLEFFKVHFGPLTFIMNDDQFKLESYLIILTNTIDFQMLSNKNL